MGERVFGRVQVPHNIKLFDMCTKYAVVFSLREAFEYVRDLPETLNGPAL